MLLFTHCNFTHERIENDKTVFKIVFNGYAYEEINSNCSGVSTVTNTQSMASISVTCCDDQVTMQERDKEFRRILSKIVNNCCNLRLTSRDLEAILQKYENHLREQGCELANQTRHNSYDTYRPGGNMV